MPKKLPADSSSRALARSHSPTLTKQAAAKPSKKHPKKQAPGHPKKHEDSGPKPLHEDLERAYCHLGRASTIGSQLETAPREFVAHFLEYGCELYLDALSSADRRAEHSAFAAAEMLRAAEHIAAAGLFAQNRKSVPAVPPPKSDARKRTKDIQRKIDDAVRRAGASPQLVRFTAAAREMLSHAEEAADAHETQLAHEFLHAAEAIAQALPRLPA